MPYHDRRRPPQFSGIGGGLRLFAQNLLAPLAEQRALESDLMKSKILNRAAEDRQIRAEKRRAAQAKTVEDSRRLWEEAQTRSTRTYEQERYERRIAKKLEAEKVRKAQIAPPALQDIYYKYKGLPGGFTGAAPPSATGIKPLTVGGAETLKDLASLTTLLGVGKKGFKKGEYEQLLNTRTSVTNQLIGTGVPEAQWNDDPRTKRMFSYRASIIDRMNELSKGRAPLKKTVHRKTARFIRTNKDGSRTIVPGRILSYFDSSTGTDKTTQQVYVKGKWTKAPASWDLMPEGTLGDEQFKLEIMDNTPISQVYIKLLLGDETAQQKLRIRGLLPEKGQPILFSHMKKIWPGLKMDPIGQGLDWKPSKEATGQVQAVIDAGHFTRLARDVLERAKKTMGVMDQPGVAAKFIDRMTGSVREAWGLLKGWNRLGGNVTSQDIQGTGEGGYILDDNGNRRAYTNKDRTTKYIYGKGGDHDTVVRRALRAVTRDWKKSGGWLSKISGTAQARHVMESTIFSMAMALMASRGIKGSRISTKLVEKTIQEIGGVNLSYGAFQAKMHSIMGRELERVSTAGQVVFGRRLPKANIFYLWGFDADPLKKVKEGPVKYIAPGRKNPTPVGKDDQYLGEDGKIRTIGKKKEDNEEF